MTSTTRQSNGLRPFSSSKKKTKLALPGSENTPIKLLVSKFLLLIIVAITPVLEQFQCCSASFAGYSDSWEKNAMADPASGSPPRRPSAPPVNARPPSASGAQRKSSADGKSDPAASKPEDYKLEHKEQYSLGELKEEPKDDVKEPDEPIDVSFHNDSFAFPAATVLTQEWFVVFSIRLTLQQQMQVQVCQFSRVCLADAYESCWRYCVRHVSHIKRAALHTAAAGDQPPPIPPRPGSVGSAKVRAVTMLFL